MPAQSLHLAGETENQKTKAGALREAEGRADSSCMEDVTSEVGLRDQERALGAQGEAAGRQGLWEHGAGLQEHQRDMTRSGLCLERRM